jgi:polysaccharide biosynthesis/export protein
LEIAMSRKSIRFGIASILFLAASAPAVRADSADPAPEPLILEAHPVDPADVPPLPPPPPTFLQKGGSDYRIGRQDLLEISVFDLKELDQTVRVADDGSITLPLLGRLQVAGLTKGELEGLIARLLSERYVRNPQVTIFVKEYESKKVAVSGAVKKPDTYEMLGEKTLLEMISLAGGLDKDLGKEIIIFRPDAGGATKRISIDLDKLVYEGDPSLNVAVLPGDIVYVPAVEKIRIFVTGAVRNPDLYEVPRSEPVTVLRAVTLAGGTTDRAAESRVQIIRTGADGKRETIAVNLKKVKRGKADDPVLQKDDLVLVPESFF